MNKTSKYGIDFPCKQKSSKNYFLLGLFFLFVNFYRSAYTNENNAVQQAINFEADTFSFNNETKLGIYRGHIKLTQGTWVLTADYATSYLNKTGKIIKIVAIGHPACYRAPIFPHQSELIATGNTIYYYPLRSWLEAIGNAQITQGQNYFKGPQINYDFKKKTVGSPASKKEHTQILLAPIQSLRS